MLETIGASTPDDLFCDIPSAVRRGDMSALPPSKSESELRSFFHQTSQKNIDPYTWSSFLGGGCYEHYIPSIVNALALRGEFLTAYTPYQAEISQGTLQAIFEFQSMVSSLTGMEVSNASMYEGASSCAESVLMAMRVRPGKHVYLSEGLHPDAIEAVRAYLSDYDIEIHTLVLNDAGQTEIKALQDETSCVVLGYPNFYGVVEPLQTHAKQIHEHGALMITSTTEAMSFAMLPSPGSQGADIVVGDAQSFGIEMNYGGPHVGIFATRKKFVRQMPGRLVGKTVDEDGRPGYVLTLSTREQHIRREKATSNICTNNSLCALKSSIYMATMGKKGLMAVAKANHYLAHRLMNKLVQIDGVSQRYEGAFFNEFVLTLPKKANEVLEAMAAKHIHAGIDLSAWDPAKENEILVTVTETKQEKDLDAYVQAMKEAL